MKIGEIGFPTKMLRIDLFPQQRVRTGTNKNLLWLCENFVALCLKKKPEENLRASNQL
jgi:hypothetical protein